MIEMKKIIIIYYLIIHLICLIPSLISVLESDLKFNTLFFFIYSLLSIIACIMIFLNKKIEFSLLFITVSNFFQSLSFVFLGVSYKFLLGPEVSFYVFNDGDLSARFSSLPYNIVLYINSFKLDDNFLLGFNFLHFFLFIFFNNLFFIEKRKEY